MYQKYFKRLLDFTGALILLFLFFPIILLLSCILIVVNKGNPFYLQKRPGKDEKIFTLIKFKTMTDEKDDDGHLLPDHKRTTIIGSLVRKSSLDELPQLINILKGDMSFIGPRPLLIRYLPYYTEEEKKRHEVRPGITGLAQVNGRKLLQWDDRFKLDLEYVRHISFRKDFIIALKTVNKVFRTEGSEVNKITKIDDLDVARKK